jgi:hypothetical protein
MALAGQKMAVQGVRAPGPKFSRYDSSQSFTLFLYTQNAFFFFPFAYPLSHSPRFPGPWVLGDQDNCKWLWVRIIAMSTGVR